MKNTQGRVLCFLGTLETGRDAKNGPFHFPSAGKQGGGDTLDRPRVPEGASRERTLQNPSRVCGETPITLKSRNPAHIIYISTNARPQSQSGRPADAQLFTITAKIITPASHADRAVCGAL